LQLNWSRIFPAEVKERKQFDTKDIAALKDFLPSAGEYYNRKVETYWYKGSSEYTTRRYFLGFSEINYAVLRFKSKQSMIDWDKRFARIGVREGWRAGEIFKNERLLKPAIVSELPPPEGLIALHVDFSAGNYIVLTGGNQHKYLASKLQGLTDSQMKTTVQAVAKELKRRALLPEGKKQTP
jgi:hypothetical protein